MFLMKADSYCMDVVGIAFAVNKSICVLSPMHVASYVAGHADTLVEQRIYSANISSFAQFDRVRSIKFDTNL